MDWHRDHTSCNAARSARQGGPTSQRWLVASRSDATVRETAIDDYVDGLSSDDAARDVDAHLAQCDECRTLVADLRAIRTLSRELPPHEPPARVWTRIEAAIEAERPSHRRPERRGSMVFSLSPFGLQQAAALVTTIMLGGGLWWVGGRLVPATEDAAVQLTAPLSMAGFGNIPLQVAEADFTAAIASLEQFTRARQDALDPDTRGVVQANLSVIEAAIDESRAVLKTEPESQVAQQSLFEALRSKVDLLQETLTLIDDMRWADPDAPDRTESGLNP